MNNNGSKKKSSLGGRKSSLPLRSWIITDDLKSNDAPSSSRVKVPPKASRSIQRPDSNMLTRIPRPGMRDLSKSTRRSSSAEPPPMKRLALSPVDDSYMANVGTLSTPMRYTPSRSPNMSVMSSVNRLSSVRRLSMKLACTKIPPKLKEERKISDKNFQSQAYAKVTKFLQNQGEFINMKPFSNSSFVAAFNIIYSQIDGAMKITTSNYVEAIPAALNQLRYPATISKSCYSAVGCSHSGTHLIAMLSWMVDTAEALNSINPREVVFNDADDTDESKVTLLTMFNAYKNWRGNSIELSTEDYYKLICQTLDISNDEENKLREEIAQRKAYLQELKREDPEKEEIDRKVLIINEIREKLDHLAKTRIDNEEALKIFKEKIVTLRTQFSNLGTECDRQKDCLIELREKVSSQKMSATERDNIRAECSRLREELESIEEYGLKLQDTISQLDTTITIKRKKADAIAQDINCAVLGKGLDSELMWQHNPFHNDVEEDFKQTHLLWDKAMSQIKSEINAQKSIHLNETCAIDKAKQNTLMIMNEIKKLQEEHVRLKEEAMSLLCTMRGKEDKLEEDIKELKTECLELAEELKDKPKSDELQQSIQEIQKEINDVVLRDKIIGEFTRDVVLPTHAEQLSNFATNVEELFKNILSS